MTSGSPVILNPVYCSSVNSCICAYAFSGQAAQHGHVYDCPTQVVRYPLSRLTSILGTIIKLGTVSKSP